VAKEMKGQLDVKWSQHFK